MKFVGLICGMLLFAVAIGALWAADTGKTWWPVVLLGAFVPGIGFYWLARKCPLQV